MQPQQIYSLRACDVMRKEFVLVSPLDTVQQAVETMSAAGSQVCIVDRVDEQDAYGIVTFQEIVYRVIAKSLPATRTRVADIMIKPLIVVNSNLRLPFVAQLFAQVGIQNAVIIDEHKAIGTISSGDLVKALIREDQE